MELTIQDTVENIRKNMERTKDIPGVTDTIILQDNGNGNLFIFLGENHKKINQKMIIKFINDFIIDPIDELNEYIKQKTNSTNSKYKHAVISECGMQENHDTCCDIRMGIDATRYFDDSDTPDPRNNIDDFNQVLFSKRLNLDALKKLNRKLTKRNQTNEKLTIQDQVKILHFLLRSLDQEYLKFILNGYKTHLHNILHTLGNSNGRFEPFIKLLVQNLTYIFFNDRKPLFYITEFGVLLNDFFIQLHLFSWNNHVNVVWYGYVHVRKTVQLMIRSEMYSIIYND